MKAGSSGLSRLSGWSDRKFIQKNQIDQKNQPTRQTNPGALREHRRSSGSIPFLAWPCTAIGDVLSQALKALVWVRIGEEQAALF
jgi:hypothetical protein